MVKISGRGVQESVTCQGELFVERLRQFDDGSGASPWCLIEQTPPRSGFARSERGARLLGADRAAGDHVDAVRDASDGRDVRLGHQNGDTSLVTQATKRLEHSSNRRRSQELRGFVDEQQSRLAHEGNRERHESLLAATEDAGALLDAAASSGKSVRAASARAARTAGATRPAPSQRLSRTERSANTERSVGTYRTVRSPAMSTTPRSAAVSPATARSVVVLPLPLCPTSATISPAHTCKSTSRITTRRPRRALRFSTLRTSSSPRRGASGDLCVQQLELE